MQNTPKRRRSLLYLSPWTVLFVYVVFMVVIVIAFVLISKSNITPNVSPTPSIEIAIETVTATPTIVVIPSPQQISEGQTPTPQLYVVQQGDTLYSIALLFGVTVDAIKVANGLSSDLIVIDQQLSIPLVNTNLSTPPFPTKYSIEVTPDPSRYQVRTSDTLESIATDHGLTVADLRNANSMVGDTLFIGQHISIPSGNSIFRSQWKFSSSDGELSQEYPLTYDTDRFILHYQPQTFPAQDPVILAQLELNGLTFLESLTGLKLEDKYDVYVAGTNFGPPDRALRGRSTSVLLRTFFLHDGTGNPDDQQYIATHELTHLFMWNTVGSPSSILISEGMAVYSGMEKINSSEHMPLDTFCTAYYHADALPVISNSSLSYFGHILDLQNYYAAGCFVEYLVESYGIEPLKLIYHSGDYEGVYGKSLNELENDWRNHFGTLLLPELLDPIELVNAVKDLENTYDTFFSTFSGTPAQLDAYRELDRARIALLQGNLLEMRNSLDSFEKIVDGT